MTLGNKQDYIDAPWMNIAESYLGTKEIAGEQNNPVIVKFFAEAGHAEIKDDETAWCSAFANAVMYEAGIAGTQNLMARSWLKWANGNPVSLPKFGDLAIFARGAPADGLGHVAFFIEADADTVTVLGGNQGNGVVSVEKMSKAKLIGYVRPTNVPSPVPLPLPDITDVVPPDNKDAEAIGIIAGFCAMAGALTGYFLIGAGVFGLLVLIGFYLYNRRVANKAHDAMMMEPAYTASRVVAEKKIAAFKAPVPPRTLMLVNQGGTDTIISRPVPFPKAASGTRRGQKPKNKKSRAPVQKIETPAPRARKARKKAKA